MLRKREVCTNGCGRTTQRPDGVCWPCSKGEPPAMPDVKRLPDAYLADCLEEAIRRQEERARHEDRVAGAVARLRVVKGG